MITQNNTSFELNHHIHNNYDIQALDIALFDFKGDLQTLFIRLINPVIRDILDKTTRDCVIVWTQLTPHFNDGEPCVFGVNDAELRVGKYNSDTDDFDLDDADTLDDAEMTLTGCEEDGYLKEFSGIICGSDTAEDALENMFGEGKIIVGYNADKSDLIFKVYEYDHD